MDSICQIGETAFDVRFFHGDSRLSVGYLLLVEPFVGILFCLAFNRHT